MPPVEGAVEVAGAALVPPVVVGAAGAAAPPSAAAPSLTVGTWMVEPITTCASGEIPFTAATVRVVRLFAAAMDHRVSPGWTVWGTEAWAEAGRRARRVIASRLTRRV